MVEVVERRTVLVRLRFKDFVDLVETEGVQVPVGLSGFLVRAVNEASGQVAELDGADRLELSWTEDCSTTAGTAAPSTGAAGPGGEGRTR